MAGEANLSLAASRQSAALFVENVELQPFRGAADGGERIGLVEDKGREHPAALALAIHHDNVAAPARWNVDHLVAGREDQPQRGRKFLKFMQHLRRHKERGDAVFLRVIRDKAQVAAQLVAQHVQLAAADERLEDVAHQAGHRRESGDGETPVEFGEAAHAEQALQRHIEAFAVMQNGLGPAGGARGADHQGRIVRLRLQRFKNCRPVQSRDEICVYDKLNAAVLHDEFSALLRVAGRQRDKSHAGLERSEQHRDDGNSARQVNGDSVAGPGAEACQSGRDL